MLIGLCKGKKNYDKRETIKERQREGIELARRIADYLEENDGTAELFPWDEIEKLRKEFWL